MDQHPAAETARVAAVIKAKQQIDKPLLVVLEELAHGSDRISMERDRRNVREALLKAGIYVTPNVYRALRALHNYSEYWKGAGKR